MVDRNDLAKVAAADCAFSCKLVELELVVLMEVCGEADAVGLKLFFMRKGCLTVCNMCND